MGRSLSAIVQVIVDEFEVAPAVARSDVIAFIEELHGLGALSVTEPEHSEAPA